MQRAKRASLPSLVLQRVSPRPVLPAISAAARRRSAAHHRLDRRPRAGGPAGDADKPREEQTLDTIRELFAALRACWVPPPKDEARHGMEYTVRFALKRDGEIIAPPRVTYSSHDAPAAVRDLYRDAVNAALSRCTPLHFGKGMGGAIAGRPIAIRFVDNRTIDDAGSLQ